MGTGASTVVLVPCPDYDREHVDRAVRRGLELLGADALAPVLEAAGRTVLLKPNMLRPSPPEKGVTTHPAVFSAVARCLAEKGARLVFGDSPSGIFAPAPTARACGLAAEADAMGIPLADFETGEYVSHPGGVRNRRFFVARGAREAGAIVNLPRLKTHGLMAMTGALKNIFGTIPGLRKAEFHLTHPDIEGFSRMIADLNGLVRSRLVVMDAIRAMEGNGPTGGDLVNVGVLILSVDPVASDAVGCRIMGFDPDSIPAITMAEESGLGNARMERIEIRGGRIEDFARRRFRAPAPSPARAVPRFVYRVAKDLAVPKPAIDAAKCTACGECVASCPTEPKSLCMDGRGSRRRGKPATSGGRRGAPSFDYSTCIRCYCCQETCPEGAIHLNRAPLARFFSGRPERPGGRHGHHR